jgi:hypothetical protein
MPSVPLDGRRQFSTTDVLLANVSLGRSPLAGVEQVGPDRYVLAGSFPTPRPVSIGPSTFVAEEPARPKTAGQLLWPHLPATDITGP